ncbi:hypothetical protein QBC35DRAFT_123291 [Podospora australis]|uniref:DUF7598 domain-containing protein n=1 Tax=Podospora australis TaxID=1536484 RepID=A0AAN6WXB2_9PEZI|nr:hypothetical protein QBC35DRAFT_123291 [Podospora australis]
MFNLGQHSKVRGSGHLVLNALRAFTVVGLVVVMAACWVMIVLSGITQHFQFFDVLSHFFVFAISIVLVISEIGLFKRWFATNFPIIGPEHSLGWLGLAQVIIGCSIMADLVKPAYAVENLGLEMWRLIISSGILAITFGAFNMLASLIFRDGPNGITARMIRSDGSLATPANINNKEYYESYASDYMPSAYTSRNNSVRHQKEEDDGVTSPSAFKRLTTMMNFRKSKLTISKPVPVGSTNSPIMPDIQRPPTAMHPAYSKSSRYSEAHMSRDFI